MSTPMLRHAWRQLLALGGLLWALWLPSGVLAHSSSNSYLTLSGPDGVLSLRADVHLRDVDLMFDLDADRDGQVTWGETQERRAELLAWLEQGLQLSASGQNCRLGAADL